MTFKRDYMRGLDALYDYAPHFYRIMRFLGVPSENSNIPTAQVSFDPRSKQVLFEINPSLIENLSDEEIGFIVAHEAYHVLLRHLSEAVDVVEYPDHDALLYAHEAIINDTVQNVLGLDAPKMDLVFGEKFGADFSGFSTREGYDWIRQSIEDMMNDDGKGDADSYDESAGDSSDNSSSSAGGSSDADADGSDSGSGDGSDSNTGEDSDDTADADNADGGSGSDDASGNGSGNDSADGTSDDDGSEASQGVSDGFHGGCGGIVVPEGFEEDFANAVADALKDAVQDLAKENIPVPADVLDAMDQIGHDQGIDITGGYGIGSNDGSMFAGSMDDMNLDWKMLIAEFNPKILSSGGPKYRDSWTSLNRRMTSVYPKVIMPNRIRQKDSGEKGDDTPTFILALDMSYSIPTRLIDGLANLADTVPDKFVKVMPITWSSHVLPFDTNKKEIVSRSGTNIDGVWDYSQQVKQEIGKEPYVFVITDGECSFNDYGWGRNVSYADRKKQAETVKKHWYWGAIDRSSISTIKSYMRDQVDPDKVYLVDDFLV